MSKEATKIETALMAAAQRLLKPVVRVLLRYGIAYQAFSEVVKRVYVDVAMEDFRIPGRKPTTSRASIMTGLTRREVARILEMPPLDDGDTRDRHSRVRTVVAGWMHDQDFRTRNGRPRTLDLEGDGGSFSSLVHRYGRDVPARAALDELLRIGAVERLDDGRIRLVAPAYIPARSEIDKIEMLGSDVADLAATIDHNIQVPRGEAFFQRKASYHALPAESVQGLHVAASTKAQRLLEQMDALMRRKNRPRRAAIDDAKRRRFVVGVYCYEEDSKEE
jgi:hypothetical protein